MTSFNIAVIGCGLIGTRRAECVYKHPSTKLELVVDSSEEVANALAVELNCDFSTNWQEAIENSEIDVVVVSTPNFLIAPIAIAAMRSEKHVLVEKPMGCNLSEAKEMQEVAIKTDRSLKIGFNHRYHPAINKAHKLVSSGEIGDIINIRARYGHGGRPGYEKEWRGDSKQAGGGELTDQGVHLIDFINWFTGLPSEVFSVLQTAFWPIAPLEDNAFAILRYKNGVVANFHTSWTQWKNLFSFEIFGEKGSLTVEGFGGSYGVETLTIAKRTPEGGVPDITEEVFDQPDDSWGKEWDDFVSHIKNGSAYLGTPGDGLNVMQVVGALYKSSSLGKKVSLKNLL